MHIPKNGANDQMTRSKQKDTITVCTEPLKFFTNTQHTCTVCKEINSYAYA